MAPDQPPLSSAISPAGAVETLLKAGWDFRPQQQAAMRAAG